MEQQSSGKWRSEKRLLYDKEPIKNATLSFSVFSFFPSTNLTFVKNLMKKKLTCYRN